MPDVYYSYSYQQMQTVTVTPKDVYETLEIPERTGYKIIDFRPPKKDEFYISNETWHNKEFSINIAFVDFAIDNPRYILKKIEEIPETFGYCITVKSVYGGPVEIPEGYRFVGFRPPNTNDYFLHKYTNYRKEHGLPYVITGTTESDAPRIIVEKI